MAEEKIDAIARAAQRVVEARNIVARQHQRISKLRALGCSTLGAEDMLFVFYEHLQSAEKHEHQLRADHWL